MIPESHVSRVALLALVPRPTGVRAIGCPLATRLRLVSLTAGPYPAGFADAVAPVVAPFATLLGAHHVGVFRGARVTARELSRRSALVVVVGAAAVLRRRNRLQMLDIYAKLVEAQVVDV